MRKMKGSGVAWIGDIPAEWDIRRIKTLPDRNVQDSFVDGDWIESPYITDEGIRYLTTGNVGDGKYKEQGAGYISEVTFNELNCKFAYPGDFVISRLNAPYGRSCILPDTKDRYVLAVDVVILRTNEDKRYLCYLSQCPGYQRSVEDMARGTAMKRISRTNLGTIQLPIPSIEEQHRIADYLDGECAKVDTLIANVQAQIEKLKAYKQSVITEVVTKGLDPTVPMKDSGVEWVKRVPNNWDILYPKALFVQRKDRARPEDKQLTASQQYGIMDQEEYMAMTGTRVVVVEKDFDILKHVEAGDFVISMRSFQGGLEYSEVSGCISSAYVMLKPSSERVYSRYYRWLLKSSLYINAIGSTSNLVRDGQAMRYANFIKIWLPCPPMDEQQSIADYLDEKCPQIDRLITIKQTKIEKLEQYKRSLIYEYVTGKKGVPAHT